jgi:hypothetical protein
VDDRKLAGENQNDHDAIERCDLSSFVRLNHIFAHTNFHSPMNN